MSSSRVVVIVTAPLSSLRALRRQTVELLADGPSHLVAGRLPRFALLLTGQRIRFSVAVPDVPSFHTSPWRTCPSLERLNADHLHIGGRQPPARRCLQLPARCCLQRPATDEALDCAPCDCAADDPAGDRAPHGRASNGPASQRPPCSGAPDGPSSDRTFDCAPGGCAADGAASHRALGDSANRRFLHRAAGATTAQFARHDRAFEFSRRRGPMISHQFLLMLC